MQNHITNQSFGVGEHIRSLREGGRSINWMKSTHLLSYPGHKHQQVRTSMGRSFQQRWQINKITEQRITFDTKRESAMSSTIATYYFLLSSSFPFHINETTPFAIGETAPRGTTLPHQPSGRCRSSDMIICVYGPSIGRGGWLRGGLGAAYPPQKAAALSAHLYCVGRAGLELQMAPFHRGFAIFR